MEACALNNLLCYYTGNDVFTKVGGRRYDYVSFVNRKGRNSRSQVFFKTDAFKIYEISQEKTYVGSLFNKIVFL